MLVVLGPFKEIKPRPKRTIFRVSKHALVPETEVALDNERIYKILYVELENEGRLYEDNALYYVIYETNNIDFYKPYLGKIPEKHKELTELLHPRCPFCGSWNVDIDGDEMYCLTCHNTDFWNEATVWKAKEVPPGTIMVQGEGIYTPSDVVELSHARIIEVVKLSEEKVKIGNTDTTVTEFIGFIRYWSGELDTGFCVYRRYKSDTFKKEVVTRVRDLTDEELANIFGVIDDLAKRRVIQMLPPELVKKLIIENHLYRTLPLEDLMPFLENDSEVMRECFKGLLEAFKNEARNGNIKDAANYAFKLKRYFKYEDEEVNSIIESYKRLLEEKEKKYKEETRKKAEELVDLLKREFGSLPVSVVLDEDVIKVSLVSRIDKKEFEKYLRKCREIGLRYDPKSKAWTQLVRYLLIDLEKKEQSKTQKISSS